MGGFRAKDADRDRYVDVIESAYVDGQLGDQDRELRISRALTAETLDELDALTRDLQNQPAPVVPRARAPRPVPAASNGIPLKGLGVAAAGIFALAVFSMASSSQLPDEPGPGAVSAPSLGYELAAPDVRAFMRGYQGKFDTSQVHEVTFLPDRVTAHVPVPGSQPSYAVWTWDGEWRRDTAPARVDGPVATVDLATLDVQALFGNIEIAEEDLGVSGAEVSRVVVRPATDGQGEVTIHVRNGSGHSARLETTGQGSRVRSVPYDG